MEASIRGGVEAGIDQKKENASATFCAQTLAQDVADASLSADLESQRGPKSVVLCAGLVIAAVAYSPPDPFGDVAGAFCTSHPSLLFTSVAVAACGAPAAFSLGNAVFISAELAQSGTPVNWY